MGRLRGHGGCVPCRVRRKKCPEQKPMCDSCLRLGLTCSYQKSSVEPPYSNRSIILGVYRLQSPLYQTQQLPTITFTSVQAEVIIANAPLLLEPFFLPTYIYTTRSINELMQVALSSSYVSDALVACLTAVLTTRQELKDPLPPQIWNQASRSIRTVLCENDKDNFTIFKLVIAIMFMGAIEVSAVALSRRLRH